MGYDPNDEEDELNAADSLEQPESVDDSVEALPSENEDGEPLSTPEEINDASDEVTSADQMQQAAASPDAPPPTPSAPSEPMPLPGVMPEAHDELNGAPKAPSNPYADMLAQYKALQETRGNNRMISGLLRAGATIGHGLALGGGGSAENDMSGYDYLDKSANLPVTDFENAMKVKGGVTNLRDQDVMRDASSPVSEFYQQMAIKRGFDPEVVKGKSAWDLSQMSKVMGKAAGPAKSRTVLMNNSKTGEKMQGIYHPDTHTFTTISGKPLDDDWQQAFKDQTFVDPKTHERVDFNTSLGRNMGPVTGPGVNAPIIETPGQQPGQPTLINRSMLNAQQAKQVDQARTAFTTEVKDDRKSLAASQRIIDVLKAGKKFGDIPTELQDQLSRGFGQTGHITDAQMGKTLGKADWRSKAANAVSLWSEGKLTDENRDFLLDVAGLIKNENEKFINDKSDIYAQNLHKDFSTSPNLQKYKFGPAEMKSLLSVEAASHPNAQTEGEVKRIDPASGRTAIFDAKTKKFLRWDK